MSTAADHIKTFAKTYEDIVSNKAFAGTMFGVIPPSPAFLFYTHIRKTACENKSLYDRANYILFRQALLNSNDGMLKVKARRAWKKSPKDAINRDLLVLVSDTIYMEVLKKFSGSIIVKRPEHSMIDELTPLLHNQSKIPTYGFNSNIKL